MTREEPIEVGRGGTLGGEPIELSIDVSEAFGELAGLGATWFPRAASQPVLVCMPGGSYNRRYFDLHVPGLDGYSFAEALQRHGFTVVAFDHLGTGNSSVLRRDIDLYDQAAAMAAAVRALPQVIEHDGPFVGVGHSMGGQVAVLQQASERSFAALAVLGTTTQWVGPLGLSTEMIDTARTEEGRDAFVQQLLEAMPDPFLAPDRSDMASWFHLDDVPRDVVAEDNRLTLTVVPRRCAAEGSAPFILHEPASHIEIPVFLAYGSVDVSPDPAREVSAFSASRDITLMRLAHSGHCHNMASTRSVLWDRIASWITALRL